MVGTVRRRQQGWRSAALATIGILLSALVPYVLRLTIDASPRDIQLANLSAGATVLAILLGLWWTRNLATYPGVESIGTVLPAFFASYAIVLFLLIVGRFNYNRTILLAGVIISILWFTGQFFFLQRARRLRIALVPLGDFRAGIAQLPDVEWSVLESPDQDVSAFDAVSVDLRIDLPSDWDRRIADYALEGIPVLHTKHLIESLTGRVELEHMSENAFGSLSPNLGYMAMKDVFDRIVAASLLVLLLPLLLAVGLAVRLTSAGPALFVQTRVGYRGKLIRIFKFRTMVTASDTGTRDAAITQLKDKRITPIGRFLRMSRLDELPQLYNVLRGDMSLIGPRPEALVLSQWYEEEIPFYRYRHIVRPGVTGWAQVLQGHVADVNEVRSKLHYDFYYIKHFSPWIDFMIAMRTIKTMVTGSGAR